MPGAHGGPDPWGSLLEPVVADFFREHPWEPDAAFDDWLREQAQLLVTRCGGPLLDRQLLGVTEHGRMVFTAPVLPVKVQVALDALARVAADAVAGRAWERWSRQRGDRLAQ